MGDNTEKKKTPFISSFWSSNTANDVQETFEYLIEKIHSLEEKVKKLEKENVIRKKF